MSIFRRGKKFTIFLCILITLSMLFSACDNNNVQTETETSGIESEVSVPIDPDITETANSETDTYIYTDPYYPSAIDWTDPLYAQHYNFTENQLKAFNIMIEAFRRNITPVAMPEGLSSEDVQNLYELIRTSMYNYSNIPLSYIQSVNSDTNDVTFISVEYNTRAEETEKNRELVEKKVQTVLDDFYDGMSDWAKIKYIHDYIAFNCQYDYSAPNPDSAYGALIEGRAMCEGYSKAFALMCNRAGIECITVTGKADNGVSIEQHMWNMVKYNGNWYHVDLTWDDPAGNDYTLFNLDYNYFMLTTSQIRVDHTVIYENKFFNIPEATATEGNYYIRKGCYIWSYEDAEKIIAEQIIKASQNGTNIVYLKAATPTLYNDIRNNIFGINKQRISNIINQINNDTDYNIQATCFSFVYNKNQHTIKLWFGEY